MLYLVVGAVAVAGLGYGASMYFFKKEEQQTQQPQKQQEKQQVEEPQKKILNHYKIK